MSSEISCSLLVLQAGVLLLSNLGLLGYAAATRASGRLLGPELVAWASVALLLALAAGHLHRARWTRLPLLLIETTLALGGLLSLALSAPTAITLTATLTTVILPLTIATLTWRGTSRCTPRSLSQTEGAASRNSPRSLRQGAGSWGGVGRSPSAAVVGRPPQRPRRSPQDQTHASAVAVLLLLTGIIHLALVPEHLSEAPLLGVLFALDGAAFLALAVAALQGVRHWRLPAVILLSATLLAYLLVIAKGQEDVDDLAMATKLIELAALGLVLIPRTPSRARWLGASTALLLGVVLTGGIAWGAELRADRLAGPPTGDHAAHADHAQLGKVVQATASPPTPEQRAAADALFEATRAGIARFQDLQAAIADGYRAETPAAPVVHYLNPAYLHGHVLDPNHPQALVYANTPRGPRLLGAMYMMPKANQPGPAIGGALTEWHTHTNLCFGLPSLMIISIQSPYAACPAGSINAPTPAMLHVWIVPTPTGPFGDLTPAPAPLPPAPDRLRSAVDPQRCASDRPTPPQPPAP